MTEQERFNLITLVLLLFVVGALTLLDWRLRGEIDYLHSRIDVIDPRPVARILRAHDDATAERIAAGEGT